MGQCFNKERQENDVKGTVWVRVQPFLRWIKLDLKKVEEKEEKKRRAKNHYLLRRCNN